MNLVKQKAWRSPKLLLLAKDCERCQGCGRHNMGDVVAAHSNQSRDGKGLRIKSHDYRVAYLCHDCREKETAGTRIENVEFWEAGHRATVGWWFQSGVLRP